MLQLFRTLSLVFCILNCFSKLTLSVVKGALKNKMHYFYYVFIIKAKHRKTLFFMTSGTPAAECVRCHMSFRRGLLMTQAHTLTEHILIVLLERSILLGLLEAEATQMLFAKS